MGFHHVTLATRDADATIAFYTDAMGFELAKVVVAPTPGHTGWARHFFFATEEPADDGTDGGMIAFWELHDERIGDCTTTRPFTAEERAAAPRLMAETSPAIEPDPPVTIFEPLDAEVPATV